MSAEDFQMIDLILKLKSNHKPNHQKIILLPFYLKIYKTLNKNYYQEMDL